MADVIQLILTAKNDASKTITQIEKDITTLKKTAMNVGTVDKTLQCLGLVLLLVLLALRLLALLMGLRSFTGWC